MKIKDVILKFKKFKRNDPKLFSDIKKIFFMLVFSFIFMFFWVNKTKLYPENIMLYLEKKVQSFSFKNEFPITLDGNIESAENINLFSGQPVILTDTSFNVATNSGKILQNQKHNLENPQFKTSSVRTLLYDVGNKDYMIFSPLKLIYKLKTENDIISCDIAENGNYGILTQSKGYLSELSVYSNKNIEKYKYYFSECYASDIAMNFSGNACCVSSIKFENGKINSSVYVLNFQSEKPENIFKLEDNTITYLSYFQNGNILAVGENYTAVINPSLKTIKKIEYESNFLKFFSFNKDYGVVCCITPSLNRGKNDKFVIIDTLGNYVKTINTNENFEKISHSKNRIVGLAENKIEVYNFQGHFEGYISTNKIYKTIVLHSDSNLYASDGKILEKIKIKNLKNL